MGFKPVFPMKVIECYIKSGKGGKIINTSSKGITGVPSGGIGAGKIRVPGVFRRFTINNNQVFPIDEMKEAFLSVSCKWKEDIKIKILTSILGLNRKIKNYF